MFIDENKTLYVRKTIALVLIYGGLGMLLWLS